MGAIRLLSEQLINRIAAGEVVERPSAVLKELIENSLDAGATHLEIEAQAGGRGLIMVADNGAGMSGDDLLLAVERHATSKLSEASDLMEIETLGFRGEALPSIGAVSRLTITSAAGRDGSGRRLRLSGGRVMAVEDAAREQGTTVEVQDLFFNVPARRKFLKSVATEAAHLLETVQRFVLGRPQLRLVYRHNGQELLSASPKEDLTTRLAQVVGRDTARGLFAFEGQADGYKLSGFLGRPDLDRSRPSGFYLFVNGRPVTDRLLTRAVLEAYRGRLPGGRYPVAVVFLALDPRLVDVNVHPAKAEVRFRQPGEVYTGAVKILQQALSARLRPLPAPHPIGGYPFTVGTTLPPRVREAGLWHNPPQDEPDSSFWARANRPETRSDNLPEDRDMARTSLVPERLGVEEESAAPEEIRPIGQLYRSYILAQGAEGLWVVDQHAAHERILFERFQDDLAQGHLASQNLLLPETMDLAPTQAVALEKISGELLRYGFDLAPFGGLTFVLKAVPVMLAGRDFMKALGEIVEAASEVRPEEGLARFEQTLLESLACHAAIKAGQELSLAEMDRLLTDLARTRVPTNCPHGRPLIFQVSRRDIEKRFQRI
jgi:DNA mismatch repair protein MutL